MATVNQIYSIVNAAAEEAIGVAVPFAKDTTSLVALGDTVLSSETNIDSFYKKLCDRIARTVIAIRSYEPSRRKVMKNDIEWGIALQKISYKMKNSTANPAWNADTQASPYDIESQTEVVQKLFSVMSTYDFSDSIPSYQLFTAFTNEAAMGAFIAGIYTNQSNQLAMAEENMANLAVNTNIALCFSSIQKTQRRNLLVEYNTYAGKTYTTAQECLQDVDFLKFAIKEILLVTKNMQKMGVVFNDGFVPRFTSSDKQVVEILSQFATLLNVNLYSDLYHQELAQLPNYEEVVYFQNPGDDYSFDNCSKVSIKNDKINNGEEVTKSGIIAFVHDIDSCGSIINRHRSGSLYNGYAERMNIWDHADTGYYVDSSENAVVFYIANETDNETDGE